MGIAKGVRFLNEIGEIDMHFAEDRRDDGERSERSEMKGKKRRKGGR